MKLRINCEKCDARKINEENYKEFSNIRIYTEELIVDDRSKEILNRLPFNIKAEEVRSKDLSQDPGNRNQIINGVYEISKASIVADGAAITVNGMLKIAPDAEEVLKKFSRIVINGVILCPKTIAVLLPLPSMVINGVTKAYPDDYVLMDNRYKLDKYFPMRAPENTGYYAASFIYDGDAETDFDKLMQKNVRFATDKIYIRKSHLEKALPLLNIEAEIVEIPDNSQVIVADNSEISDQLVSNYGKNLYIIGNAHVTAANLNALNSIESLTVEGEITADHECSARLSEIGARYEKLIVSKGKVIEDCAIATVDKELLEDAVSGILVQDCALLRIDKDVPPELIRQRLKIRDCAKVVCSNEQKASVSSVSSDVAFIGGEGMKSIFSSIFGFNEDDNQVQPEASAFEDDTKYINAEFYEL